MQDVTVAAKKRTIVLVVDDEPAILRLISPVLEELGCEISTAPDAETALELLKTSRPNLIITDVKLPGIDGVELTKQVKSSHELPSIRVLLMSAFGEPPYHQGDGFLSKPFDIDQIAASVRPYLRMR